MAPESQNQDPEPTHTCRAQGLMAGGGWSPVESTEAWPGAQGCMTGVRPLCSVTHATQRQRLGTWQLLESQHRGWGWAGYRAKRPVGGILLMAQSWKSRAPRFPMGPARRVQSRVQQP